MSRVSFEWEINGHNFYKEFDVSPGRVISIGRDTDNDCIVHDNTVSLHHCSLSVDESLNISLNDTASENGTFIGGARLNTRSVKEKKLIFYCGLVRFELLVFEEDKSNVIILPPMIPRLVSINVGIFPIMGMLMLVTMLSFILLLPNTIYVWDVFIRGQMMDLSTSSWVHLSSFLEMFFSLYLLQALVVFNFDKRVFQGNIKATLLYTLQFSLFLTLLHLLVFYGAVHMGLVHGFHTLVQKLHYILAFSITVFFIFRIKGEAFLRHIFLYILAFLALYIFLFDLYGEFSHISAVYPDTSPPSESLNYDEINKIFDKVAEDKKKDLMR